MPDAPRICDTHLDLFNFKHRLPHLAESLKRQRKIRIVAIGSSSTLGEGEVTPYPLRLQMALRGRFHDLMIDVLNRGMSGQEAPSELARFEPDVFAEAPALVIWQIGTNAVFRNEQFNFEDIANSIAAGLRWIGNMPMDVVLMDLQYATSVVEPKIKLEQSEDMVRRIAAAAAKANVNVFRRFDLMRHWVEQDHIPLQELVRQSDPLKLHMSEWATGCVSAALFQSIKQVVEADGVT